MLDEFIRISSLTNMNKEQQAELFMWYHLRTTGEEEIRLQIIKEYFRRASLPEINVTRIKNTFLKSKRVCRGSQNGTFRLVRNVIEEFDSAFGNIFYGEPQIIDRAGIINTPFLDESSIKEAQRMAELYLILHCYENSARQLIEKVLSNKLGSNWWDIAANASLKGKYKSRKEVESRNLWLAPRGKSPLFYLDWGDLLSLIRKYENDFKPFIKEIDFIILRFQELEKVRNIVAHNGYLPSNEDFDRVILSFRDWCRQVKV